MALDLVPIRRGDIAPGQPLPWAVYDHERQPILAQGHVIDAQAQVDALIAVGAYRPAGDAKGPVEKPVTGKELVEKPGVQQGAGAPAQQQGRGAAKSNAEQVGFEDMRLQVGDPIQLQARSRTERYYVRLIGYAPGRSVLVTKPKLDSWALLTGEDEGFVARAFSGKNAFAFDTSVRRVCNLPFPYMHLAFPERVQGVSVRREARVRLRVIASVTCRSAPAEPRSAVIGDLSPSGARIEARELLAAKGETFQVAFRLKLDGDEAYFLSEAIVRSVTEEPPGVEAREPCIMHGVEFMGMEANERLLLRTLIFQRLAEGGRDEPEAP